MSATAAVRGVRRVDLISADPMAAAVFYRAVLDWSPVPAGTGFDCWVGNRRCAAIRKPRAGEPLGFRLVFAGAAMDYTLTGPDDTIAQLAKGRAQHGPWAPEPRPGEPCWVDLTTREPERADEFWCDTLGWQIKRDEPVEFLVAGRAVATRFSGDRPGGTGWLCHLALPDLGPIARLATKHGGTTTPIEHPRFAEALLLTDPGGAEIGLAPTENWG